MVHPNLRRAGISALVFASPQVTAAKQLALRVPSMPSLDLRHLLASLVWRITLYENKIEIKVRQSELRQRLENGGKVTSASVPVKNPIAPGDLISLTVEAKRKKDVAAKSISSCHRAPASPASILSSR